MYLSKRYPLLVIIMMLPLLIPLVLLVALLFTSVPLAVIHILLMKQLHVGIQKSFMQQLLPNVQKMVSPQGVLLVAIMILAILASNQIGVVLV